MIFNKNTLIFSGLTILPAVTFYFYRIFIEGALARQAQTGFIPGLISGGMFWGGWPKMLFNIMGPVILILSLLGIPAFKKGISRATIIGLWLGYVLFGFVFTYYICTLDYYSMILIPIAALSVGPIAAAVIDFLKPIFQKGNKTRAAAIALVILSSMICLYYVISETMYPKNAEKIVEMAREIGEKVNHSMNNIMLALNEQHCLIYHGEFVFQKI